MDNSKAGFRTCADSLAPPFRVQRRVEPSQILLAPKIQPFTLPAAGRLLTIPLEIAIEFQLWLLYTILQYTVISHRDFHANAGRTQWQYRRWPVATPDFCIAREQIRKWRIKQLSGIKMEKMNPISEELIAPCGMNCAICSRHLSYVNNLKRSQCAGCRPGNKRCTYLFIKCDGINNKAKGNAAFCFECNLYPCKQINRIDNRYRISYRMSMKDNLEYIKKMGISKFIEEQYKKYHCAKCGGLISIHNRKCFKCDTITKLVEKI